MTLVGHEGIAYLTPESTFGVRVAISGSDALSYESIELKPKANKHERKEHTGSASSQGFVLGRVSGTGSIKGEIKLNAAGTEPECGNVLLGGIGSKTVSGSSLYELQSRGDSPPSFQLAFELGIGDGSYHSVQANGVVITKLVIEQEDDKPATFAADFEFADLGGVFATVDVSGAVASGQTTIQLATGDAKNVREGAQFLAQFASEDNGGSGYTVTDVDITNDQLTITPALANGISDGDQVKVLLPTAAHPGGNPVPATESALEIGGASGIKFAKYSVEIEAGYKLVQKESGEQSPGRAVRGDRKIGVSASFITEDENSRFLGDSLRDCTVDLECRFGPDTSGSRIKLDTPSVVIHEGWSMSIPDDEAVSHQITGTATQSSSADDELTVEAD